MAAADRPGSVVSVLVVDDHEMVADALAQALDDTPGLMVVGRAGTVAEACQIAADVTPDVIVMDFRLPDGTGIEATARIRADLPETEVVLLTAEATPSVLAAALEAGCTSLVRKEGGIANLVRAIERTVAGVVVVPDELLPGLVGHLRAQRDAVGGDLTERELEVLSLLALGCSTNDLVEQLVISRHTVRNHVRNTLAKLGAHSRLEAVAIAVRSGLVDPPTP